MKNRPAHGRSMRNGNAPAPYTKYNKRPFEYAGTRRLANGNLAEARNQHPSNKYR